MAKGLDIKAFTDGVAKNWWQWTLIGIVIGSSSIGILGILWAVWKYTQTRLSVCWTVDSYDETNLNADTDAQKKPDSTDASRRITTRLQQQFDQSTITFSAHGETRSKPTSFGVYLGIVHYPPTADETRLLAQYDLLVLDPSQAGVLDILADGESNLSPHIVGRLDMQQLLNSETLSNEAQMIRSLERILVAIDNLFQHPGAQRAFTGLLLSGWHNLLPISMLDALAKYICDLGLDVYLEIVPPHFLEGSRLPELEHFAGVIVKNGTILPNGEARDYFQMEHMKSTTKAYVSQSCLRPFTVMMWDTVADRIELSHAIVKRSYMWCGYHGALVWIGPDASLTNPECNVPVLEPLAAFQWLKDAKVMKIHEEYRSSRQVNKLQTALSAAANIF